jgi:hypothetical protein
VTYFDVPTPHLFGETEKTHKTQDQNTESLGRDSNPSTKQDCQPLHRKVRKIVLIAPNINNTGKVYSLEFTDIPKGVLRVTSLRSFFTNPIRSHCCASGHSCITVIRGHCTTVCSSNDLSCHYCEIVTPVVQVAYPEGEKSDRY